MMVVTIQNLTFGFGRSPEINMRNVAFAILLSMALFGCSLEERPSWAAIENTLPQGGPTVHYEPSSGLSNVGEVSDHLTDSDALKFNASLGWYGTESVHDLKRLDGKTAREVIDIVNCLKVAEKESQIACF